MDTDRMHFVIVLLEVSTYMYECKIFLTGCPVLEVSTYMHE